MTSAAPRAELFVHTHDGVGESPVWSVHDQRLWWSDIEGQRIHALNWSDREVRTLSLIHI